MIDGTLYCFDRVHPTNATNEMYLENVESDNEGMTPQSKELNTSETI